jgi:flagellar basal body-associated protein FliL
MSGENWTTDPAMNGTAGATGQGGGGGGGGGAQWGGVAINDGPGNGGGGGGGGEGGKGGKGGGKKKIIMIVVGLAVAGVGAKMTVLKGKAEAKEPVKVEPVEGEIADVGSLTVNLADPDRHYGRVGIALVLNATANHEEVSKKIPLMKDAAITAIGSHTSAELRTSAGQEALRKELMEAASKVWEEDVVLRIALTELVIQ